MFYFYKLMFFLTLLIGTLISISSYTWMGMWLGLEINLLSFIPLMSSTYNSMKSEAALKYFITQVLASTILLFSIIIMSLELMYNINMNYYLMLILNSALFLKMGAAPFHFWFPEIIEGLTWNNSLILMTWQKIAPMILIMYTNFILNYMMIIVIMSSVISGIMGINQTSLRKILAYSSINHISWMLCSSLFMETLWIYYFLTYSLISMNIIIIFKKFNIFYLKQLFISLNNQPMIKLFFVMNFLSLGGLPPFLGFMPKWLTIQNLISNNFYSISIIIIVMTLIVLYFYMQIVLKTLILSINEISFYKNNKLNFNMIYSINLITLISLIMITMLYNLY